MEGMRCLVSNRSFLLLISLHITNLSPQSRAYKTRRPRLLLALSIGFEVYPLVATEFSFLPVLILYFHREVSQRAERNHSISVTPPFRPEQTISVS